MARRRRHRRRRAGARGLQRRGQHRQTDGAFADILPEDDRFEQTAVNLGAGFALGPRASLRTGLRYSDGNGRNVGPINYGSRDTGGVYESDDLSWHVDGAHAIGAWYTGTASFNYFRYDSLSADTIADAEFGTYTILEGTQNAIFPNGPRLVRTIDQAEFLALSATGALPAPGQFLASSLSYDYPFDSESAFRRPGFRYQGDVAWGGGQRLSAGYEWERESNPLTEDPSLTNNAFFVQQQVTFRDRWFATVGGRVDSKESYDTFFSPKLSAGGFLLPFSSGGVSSLKVFGNIGQRHQVAHVLRTLRRAVRGCVARSGRREARTSDIGVEATFVDQRFRGSLVFFDNHYTDQVAYTGGFVGDGRPEYINIDGSKAHGWEIELALQRPVGGLTASASYALSTARSSRHQHEPAVSARPAPPPPAPRNSGAIRAVYARGRTTVNFNMRIVGQRHDNSFLFLSTVPNVERPTSFTTDITVNPVVAIGVHVVLIAVVRATGGFGRPSGLAASRCAERSIFGRPVDPAPDLALAAISPRLSWLPAMRQVSRCGLLLTLAVFVAIASPLLLEALLWP